MARLFLHPSITHAQAEQVCRENNLTVEQDGRGNISLRRREQLAEARKKFGRPFAHQPGTDWKPRAVPVLTEWMQSRGRKPDNEPGAA